MKNCKIEQLFSNFDDMAKKVIHIEFKGTGTHDYFASMAAVFTKYTDKDLGVSLSTIQKITKTKDYENSKIKIRWGQILSVSDIRAKAATA